MGIRYESFFEDGGEETVVCIHSLFSSSIEWKSTTLHLNHDNINTRFHVVLTSLNPNEISNLDYCVSELARLIEKRGKNGKAHVVGISIGARIAVSLAMSHPERVSSLVVSGHVQFSPSLKGILSLGIYTRMKGITRRTKRTSFSWVQSRQISRLLCSDIIERPSQTRILILAGLVDDNPIHSKVLSRKVKAEAFGVPGKIHNWTFQDPKLFASVIRSWATNNKLPEDLDEEFVSLGGIS